MTAASQPAKQKRDLFYRLSTIAVADIIDIAHTRSPERPIKFKTQTINVKWENTHTRQLNIFIFILCVGSCSHSVRFVFAPVPQMMFVVCTVAVQFALIQ